MDGKANLEPEVLSAFLLDFRIPINARWDKVANRKRAMRRPLAARLLSSPGATLEKAIPVCLLVEENE